MERAKKKRLNHLRVITTNILMGISVIAIAGTLTLLAMGYTLTKDGGLERSGLLQVRSYPSGATVEINGETQPSRTEMRKMLSEGSHDIIVTKSGYSTWSTTVDIESGLLTRIDWIRLFPLKRTIETVRTYRPSTTDDAIKHVSVSPDKQYLAIIYPGDEITIQLIDIRTDEIKYNNIPFTRIAGLAFDRVGDPKNDHWEITQWSEDNSKFILKLTTDGVDASTWFYVNIAKLENNIWLNRAFMLNFTDLQFANSTGTKIWTLENGNLRLINTVDATISSILLNRVEKYSASNSTIGLIGINAQEKRFVGIYQEGEQGSTTVQEIESDISSYHVALGKNWADNWIAYTLNNRLFVRAGNYPSYQNNTKLRTIAENDLSFTPTKLTTNLTNRFVVASSGENISSFDVEIKRRYEFEFPGNTVNWLDNFILWTDQDDKLTIIDFNGENRREITALAHGFSVALTSNNRWLYFISPTEENSYLLRRERL